MHPAPKKTHPSPLTPHPSPLTPHPLLLHPTPNALHPQPWSLHLRSGRRIWAPRRSWTLPTRLWLPPAVQVTPPPLSHTLSLSHSPSTHSHYLSHYLTHFHYLSHYLTHSHTLSLSHSASIPDQWGGCRLRYRLRAPPSKLLRLITCVVQGSGFRVQGIPPRTASVASAQGGVSYERGIPVPALFLSLVFLVVWLVLALWSPPTAQGTSLPLKPARERLIYWRPTGPKPICHRDDLVDRPRAMGVWIPFSR